MWGGVDVAGFFRGRGGVEERGEVERWGGCDDDDDDGVWVAERGRRHSLSSSGELGYEDLRERQ